MDSQTPSLAPESDESPSQQQARLRRERREAKIKAGGSSRLDKITQLSGRPAEPAPPPHAAFPNPSDDDPSALPPNNRPAPINNNPNAAPTEADIRALLRSGAPPPGNDTTAIEQDEDPMMRMLSQLMGGQQGQEGAPEGLPPALAAMLGAQGQALAAPKPAASASLWRILHTISALLLGIYLATHATLASTSRLSDPRSTARPPASAASGEELVGRDVFWIFAATEAVLQGSRMVLEGNRGAEMQGWVGVVMGVLPEPWRGWVRLGVRYRGVWGTVVEDGMVVLFLVGAVGWWRGYGG